MELERCVDNEKERHNRAYRINGALAHNENYNRANDCRNYKNNLKKEADAAVGVGNRQNRVNYAEYEKNYTERYGKVGERALKGDKKNSDKRKKHSQKNVSPLEFL